MTKTVARRLNAPIHAVWITLAAYAFFVLVKLALVGFNPTVFINAGDRFAHSDALGNAFMIKTNSDGYDGQFFYRLALTPFTGQVNAHGISLDSPPYRHQRIVYPLLARIMALGRYDLVPWGLVAANLAALAGLAWVGATFAVQSGRHALWGLIIPFFPGFLMSLAFDLAEIVQAAFILLGIRAVAKRQYLLAAGMLTLAGMTREPALIVPGVGLLTVIIGFCRHDRNIRAVVAFAAPLVAYAIWQFALYLDWGQFSALSDSDQITFPLVGLVHGLAALKSMPLKSIVLYFLEMGFLILFTLTVISVYRGNPALRLVRGAWVVYAALQSVLSSSIWEYGLSFLRVSAEFFVLGCLIILASNRSRLLTVAAAGQAILWLVLFVKFSVIDA